LFGALADSCIIVCFFVIQRLIIAFLNLDAEKNIMSQLESLVIPRIASSLTFEKEILMTAYSSFSSCFISGVFLMRLICGNAIQSFPHLFLTLSMMVLCSIIS